MSSGDLAEARYRELLEQRRTPPPCSTCEDEGWACYPHADPQRIECPGEECGTCDYAAPNPTEELS